MKFCVLGSGSKGNSTYVESNGVRLLIDAGLSAKCIEERLEQIGIPPSTIDAMIITHEHSDHINGVRVFQKRYGCPIYMTDATFKKCPPQTRAEVKACFYKVEKAIKFDGVEIQPFAVSHDAVEPVALVIEARGKRLGIATDLGYPTQLVRHKLKGMDALVIESNHDVRMLMAGPYPWEVKERIKSREGHLSNSQTAELLAEIVHSNLKTVVLAHLSETNNTPETALESAMSAIKSYDKIKLVVSAQHRCTELFSI